MSDSDVRITAISVRSALMRVRWNAIPVWRADSSPATSWEEDPDVARRRSGKVMVFLYLCRPLRTALVLQTAGVLHLAIEEVAEKCPNRGDCAEVADFVPRR